MQKEIKLGGKKVKYILKNNRRGHHVRLTIGCDGTLTATKPWWTDENAVEKFIAQKAEWIISKIEYFKRFDSRFFARDRKSYLAGKEAARKLVEARLAHFNRFYGFRFGRISIRKQKSRWGSCSKKGNLNFNYKIALLPGHLADYIIVHELCHLKEFNHSRKFWSLVSRAIPEDKKAKRELSRMFKK